MIDSSEPRSEVIHDLHRLYYDGLSGAPPENRISYLGADAVKCLLDSDTVVTESWLGQLWATGGMVRPGARLHHRVGFDLGRMASSLAVQTEGPS
jgi:hypothetical protein